MVIVCMKSCKTAKKEWQKGETPATIKGGGVIEVNASIKHLLF